MTQPKTGNEEADFDLQYARAAAFGAYVMTATSFEYGLEAGRAIRDRGEQPTLERAEDPDPGLARLSRLQVLAEQAQRLDELRTAHPE